MSNLVTAAMAATNAVTQIAAATGEPISWTTILSVLTVSLTAMATLIKIFSGKVSVKDEDLKQTTIIQTLSEDTKYNKKKQEELIEIATGLRTDVERLKVETVNSSKTIEELRKDYRDLVQRLDELLNQLLDWVNS